MPTLSPSTPARRSLGTRLRLPLSPSVGTQLGRTHATARRINARLALVACQLGRVGLVALAMLLLAVTTLTAAPPTGTGATVTGAAAEVAVTLAQAAAAADAGPETPWQAGLATRDITPQTPIRLAGFGNRRQESEGVRQSLRASALALSAGSEPPVVLLTLDAMAISYELVQDLARRVQEASGLPPERLAVLCTHSHTAPVLTNVCPTLFSVPIPPDHQRHIDDYTQELLRLAAEAACDALAQRQPARLEWAIGRAGFARNRRTAGGPVDHDLPLLLVRHPDGAIRGVYVSYACHAVTLSDNRVSGDWPGYAREHLERLFPGATALVSVGCGADSNPASGVTGDKADVASAQGLEIAQSALRLAQGPLQPVSPPLVVNARQISLPYDPLPSQQQWEERAVRQDAVGYHARVQLEKLARQERLPTELPYPVRSFAFGKSLAMLFLPGEVVVDYSLRLKRELDGTRLWTNGYSNGVPCYIPSDRVWKEGGYEGGDAMVYFDRPTRFAPGLEDPLVAAAVEPLREPFAPRVDARRTRGSVPLSPSQSLAALRTAPGLKAELVAAEPLVTSPVAVDFAPDGSVWVAEMYDYPQGLDGQYQPGGRVRKLVSSRDDGRFDQSHIFLDGIPFPTGVTSWRDGVLVCAAPDILYAVDTNRDGRADSVTVLYTGFGTHNYQARVNSLEPGLDGWLYGSCGLFGGTITSHTGQRLELGDRDFRIHPDSGAIEPAVGRTQQGRPRNDAGDWFGCDNSTLIRHYPLPADVRARNPHVLPPPDSGIATTGSDPFTLHPAREVQLFQLSGPSGRATAACGLGIYRDDLLGPGFRGNAFICEPVNLLVHRMALEPAGSQFAARLPNPDQPAEFVASLDTWFRPVQARTAPDGSLWIVDMHRFVIEHPRWIPAADVAQLDTRAGHDMGRLYRILPEAGSARPWPRLAQLSSTELVAALDSPNGWQRDTATLLLQWRNAREVLPQLGELAQSATNPYARLHALCLMGVWGEAAPAVLRPRFADPDPAVRRHAVRLAAAWTLRDTQLADAVCDLATDDDPQVRLQVIDTLANCPTERAAQALASLATQPDADAWQRGAVLASLTPRLTPAVLHALLHPTDPASAAGTSTEVLGPVVQTALAWGGAAQALPLLRELVREDLPARSASQPALLVALLEASRRDPALAQALQAAEPQSLLATRLTQAVSRGADNQLPLAVRIAELQLLGRLPAQATAERALIAQLLSQPAAAALHPTAVEVLVRQATPAAAQALIDAWPQYGPALKPRVLAALASRPAWHPLLLDALAEGTIPPGECDRVHRQTLLQASDRQVAQRAAALFDQPRQTDRAALVTRYTAALASLKGDAKAGQALFVKTCAACHALAGVGHAVGPDLAAVANKPAAALLPEIFDPNRNTDSRYLAYTALTRAGVQHSGLLASETEASVSLLAAEGRATTLLRADLEELRSSGQSLMPEGLEKDLDPQATANLLAFLSAQQAPAKTIPGNEPKLVVPHAGQVPLIARHASLTGGDITYEGAPFYNIGMWHGANDQAAWQFELTKPAKYAVWVRFACAPDCANNVCQVDLPDRSLRFSVPSTGGWDRYQWKQLGEVPLAAGRHSLVVRPADGQVRHALLDLQGVYLVPPGAEPQLPPPPTPTPTATMVLGTPAQAAARILDDRVPVGEREAVVPQFLHAAPALMTALLDQLPTGTPEEYRRIPWIWRVAIAAGKQNETKPLRELLELSLPVDDAPLHDWQAVVLGGGLINGLSQRDKWPVARLVELTADQPALRARLARAAELADRMAVDPKVPSGTRYDALRMLPLRGWELAGPRLKQFLPASAGEELQMGAVSGLVDLDHAQVPALLLQALPELTAGNRELALQGLTRTDERRQQVLAAIAGGTVRTEWVSPALRTRLQTTGPESLRSEAQRLLPTP